MIRKLGIVLVNYKMAAETVRFVQQEMVKIRHPKTVVIVNNECPPEDRLLLERELRAVSLDPGSPVSLSEEGIYLLNPAENLGFARANNLGAFLLLAKVRPDYLLFTNNDLRILTPDVAEQLMAKLEERQDVAMIGPRIVNSAMERISPRYDRISPNRFILQHLFYPIRASRILTRLGIRSPGRTERERRNIHEGYCYWVSGTFFMVRACDFQAVEGFDPNTFLYGEEKILAERFRKIGKKAYYYSLPEIFSDSGMTTDRYLRRKERDQIIFRSDIYYYNNYFEINRIQKFLLTLSYQVFFNLYYGPRNH